MAIKYKLYRGKYCGLSAVTISYLLGTSPTNAKRWLYAAKAALQRDLTLDDIGKIIYQYRSVQNDTALDSFLNRWTGPVGE